MGGRARAEKAKELWAPDQQSWKKWTRCWLCGNKFCVNNNQARQVRVNRIRGVVYCPWHRKPDQLIELLQGYIELSTMPCSGRKKDRKKGKKCPCPSCRARRRIDQGRVFVSPQMMELFGS